jgi:type III pantothenate kinase
MLLAIDTGNTQTVLGLIRDGEILRSWRITSDGTRTEDELWVYVHLLCHDAGISIPDIKRTVISSVVPQMNAGLRDMSREYLNTDPLFVTPSLPFRHNFLEGRFQTLGADRICNMYAGLTAYPLPQIIIDFGTATTVDILDSEGKYLGGSIAPGIRTSSANLFRAAAQLHGIAMEFPEHVIGTDTSSQLRSGILWGAVDQTDGMVRRIIRETGLSFPTILSTGGLAEMVSSRSETITKTIPDLTLKGLTAIADEIIPEP